MNYQWSQLPPLIRTLSTLLDARIVVLETSGILDVNPQLLTASQNTRRVAFFSVERLPDESGEQISKRWIHCERNAILKKLSMFRQTKSRNSVGLFLDRGIYVIEMRIR